MSALRRWLREERAREHAAWVHERRWPMWCAYGLASGLVTYYEYPGTREPTADVHIHGRDCDAAQWYEAGMRFSPIALELEAYTKVHRFTDGCNVEGRWR